MNTCISLPRFHNLPFTMVTLSHTHFCSVLSTYQSILYSGDFQSKYAEHPTTTTTGPKHFSMHALTRDQDLFMSFRYIKWNAQVVSFDKCKALCNPNCYQDREYYHPPESSFKPFPRKCPSQPSRSKPSFDGFCLL